MRLEGHIYQQNSVKREEASIVVDGAYYKLYLGKDVLRKALLDELDIPSRIGNTSRKIQLDEHTLFETMDNDLVDQMFFQGEKHRSNWIHVLESKWRVAIPAIFLGMALIGSIFFWGVPFAAEKIAYSIPESINEKISKGSFEAIDKLMLTPSQIPEEKQQAISKKFDELVANYIDSEFRYRLHFRDMSGEPNAFALPDGNIVVTDKLIEYADGEMDEVLAVLLHEIGHVEKRHGLRLALEASSTALIIAMLTGDLSASDDLLVTLPTVLSTSAFSRHHEEEADEFAFEYMQQAKIDPIHFARIMKKITDSDYVIVNDDEENSSSNAEKQKIETGEKDSMSKAEKVLSYMSSHPVTEERIRKAEEASKVFNH